MVYADKPKIYEMISNLLNNAVKFTENGGTITVSARTEKDGTVVVKVKDTGAGIVPKIMPRLFTKFASQKRGRAWAVHRKEHCRGARR